MINDLLRWRQEATKEDWSKLAQLAKTSTGYLDQIAYGYRRASPQMAENIEKGTKIFKRFKSVSKEKLVFAELKTKAA
ncbi:MAG: transcriptional regulator [Mixta calida]|uniref:transcriptional regulator n=1 Tax=Mixta calida TaxID=665913 RepID=UPI00290F6580|nr:transcriptional regulator [Mixta calida]MDU4943868.1 transcriptional regulator [Mixta calida]